MTPKETIGIETLLLVVLLAIIGIRGELPSVIFYALLFIFIISMSFLPICTILRPWFSSYRMKRKLKKRDSLIIIENVPKFKDFVDRFTKLIKNKGYDDISYLVNDIKHRSGIKEFQDVPFPEPIDIIKLVDSLKRIFESLKWDKTGFANASELFFEIVEIYNEYCVCKPIIKFKETDKKIDVETKKRYNRARQSYIQFLDEYSSFVRKVNKKFEGKILSKRYYDIPEEL